jgi:SAM-dependent methyltransferase
MNDCRPRFYDELPEWWPLFSPPVHYDEEAADLRARLGRLPTGARPTLLELGSGGGSLASHLSPHFKLTLTDRSPGMLEVNKAVNPDAEHIVGDMRNLRLSRQFDVVLVHDAIMYATRPQDVQSTLETAAIHCTPGGRVIVLPDFVRETFTPGTSDGGEDGSDGRGLRYLEWRWDPDAADDTYIVDYAFQLRDTVGRVRAIHDRHVEGLFTRAQWLAWFEAAGLQVQCSLDRWGRDVFLATKNTGSYPQKEHLR